MSETRETVLSVPKRAEPTPKDYGMLAAILYDLSGSVAQSGMVSLANLMLDTSLELQQQAAAGDVEGGQL